MKILNLNSRLARRATATLVLGLVLGAQTAMACTVDNWSDNSGNVIPGGPNSGGIVRYAGICAMETPASTAAWVQDDNPGGINRIRARFYILNRLDAGQSPFVYQGFSSTDGSGSLFTVRLSTGGTVILIDNASGQTVTQAGGTNWASIEIDWSQGSGDGVISLSVNGQTPQVNSTLNNDGAGLQSVRLGNLTGAAGTLGFDAYESRRTTEIGRLCRGNPEGDGARDISDLQVLFTELQTLGGTPSPGTPDANEDGSVGLPDLTVIFGLIQSLQGDCSAFPG